MRKTLAALALIALAGCATSPVPSAQAIKAPADRVLAYQVALEGSGTLTVIRDSGFMGSGCYATIFLNGERAAKLAPEEKATFILAPGEWVVGAAIEGAGLCGQLNEKRTETETILKKGQEKYFRVFSAPEAGLDVRPTSL
ncbi:hypothetical protein [Pseudomonas sp. FP1742]|uniref:hypothetical protein n=1 Tax=Pseudomonas sp. FP1742 TaxID=2954079 RepID=UPI0027331C9B|nr:hypothetical protein [Pseudomonas sp. FP1742]WLG49102.1 hypothetical protein PSH64_20505 [Pseudomonas sp. FP1742]